MFKRQNCFLAAQARRFAVSWPGGPGTGHAGGHIESEATTVPTPAALMSFGLGGLAAVRRRRTICDGTARLTGPGIPFHRGMGDDG